MLFDGHPPFFVLPRGALFGRQALSLQILFLTAGLAALLIRPTTSHGQDRVLLQADERPGATLQVHTVLEVRGELKLNADGKRVTRLPLVIKGEQLHDERILEATPAGHRRRDLRIYRQAEATLGVGETGQTFSLDPERRLIVAHTTADPSLVLFSPLGPLTREELELVDVQANSAVLSRLLPNAEQAPGDRWSHDEAALGLLLGLDALTQCDVSSTLRKVERSVAIVDLQGSVHGAVRGISSDIQLEGKYNFDLQQKRVTWMALSIREDRAVGHAEPGLDVEARVRVAVSPLAACPELADEATGGLPLDLTLGVQLLRLPSAAGSFEFLYGRQWRVMVDRDDVTILRMIDQGDLIAQCNASKLPPLPAGQQLQLEAFQADIQRALGENFGEFVTASQSQSETGLRVLRTVVTGSASELPIQWSYYHLADEQGHQLALVFAMDARLVERFAEADQILVSSLQFVDPSADEPSLPTEQQNLQTASAPGGDHAPR